MEGCGDHGSIEIGHIVLSLCHNLLLLKLLVVLLSKLLVMLQLKLLVVLLSKLLLVLVLKLLVLLVLKLMLVPQSYMMMGEKCSLLLALPVKFYVELKWNQTQGHG